MTRLHPRLRRLAPVWVLAVIASCVGSALAPSARADAPVIAAAADLKFALTEIAQRFRDETGHAVRLTFGSSGNFFTQIKHGAPFQLFLSADEAYVKKLGTLGLTRDEGVLYAVGCIVLFAPNGSKLEVDGALDGLRAALSEGRISRFAIANPEHAPYGRAAREALRTAGLWSKIAPSLVVGENASQAMLFATSGSAEGGIVPLSLARAPEAARRGTWAVLQETLYSPLRQRMVLLRDAGGVADAFYDYVQAPPARAILERYGFVLPATN